MRMFVAVVPPAPAREHLEEFLDARRDAPGLRWSGGEHLHLTLAFLPQVADRFLEPLQEALGERLARIAPFAMALGAGGAFPNPYAARVLYVGVESGEGELQRVARATRHTAGPAGVAVDGGRFHPHVTVARARRPVEATRWLRILDTYAGPAWVAQEAVLIESRLGAGRGGSPLHTPVAHFAFAG